MQDALEKLAVTEWEDFGRAGNWYHVRATMYAAGCILAGTRNKAADDARFLRDIASRHAADSYPRAIENLFAGR